MNSSPTDSRLQDLLDRHAAGAAVEVLLAEARKLPEGEALAVDLALALALSRELPARLPAVRRAVMQAALQEAFQAQQAKAAQRSAFAFLPGRLAFRLGAAALAGALALGGGVVASAESLPGDALYPIKRAAEAARLAFTWAPESRARAWMELSDLRHQEIQDLDAAGRPSPDSLMEAWLAAHRQAREEAQASGDPLLLQSVDEQAARHARDLEQLPQPGASDAADRLRDAAGQEPQPASAPQDPAIIGQPVSAATASPLPATATTASGEQGGAGQGAPSPTLAASATPRRPRDGGGSDATPPSQATRDAWATERAGRPTDEHGRGGPGGRGDDPRRATEEARREALRATERARRGQQATPDPSLPTALPRPTLPPGIGPTEGPPPGPPKPTKRPFPTPDPQRTPGGPGQPGDPRPTWPPRRGTPPAPPTVAPDPSEQPVPTTLSGEAPTPVATPSLAAPVAP